MNPLNSVYVSPRPTLLHVLASPAVNGHSQLVPGAVTTLTTHASATRATSGAAAVRLHTVNTSAGSVGLQVPAQSVQSRQAPSAVAVPGRSVAPLGQAVTACG